MTDLDAICNILDKLTLDALTVIEEEIQSKINVENAMCDGETHLAKSRYILGQNNVSALQLPTENSPTLEAPVYVVAEEEEFLGKSRRLEVVKTDDHIDPVRWFGYLVPQDLFHAQSRFKRALQWIIIACNLQTRLIETCTKIQQLKTLKRELIANTE